MRTLRALLLLSTFALAACGGRLVAVGGPRGTLVTQTDDATHVRDALARALTSRRFTIEGEEPGALIARFDRGAIMLRIRIDYSATEYRITYVDSTGLDFQVDPASGQAVISPHYNRYVTALDRIAQRELGRPAREAQEAEEAEREHQLALQQAETNRQVAVERERQNASRREARAQRRERRRERWAEYAAQQQETERERLRAQAAQAEADRARADAEAEQLRRMPPPVFSDYGRDAVVVERFAFQEDDVRASSLLVEPGFRQDPFVVRGAAAGNTPSRALGLPDACPGFWSREPQHVISLPRGMRFLRVEVTSRDDTTLAIVTPDGQVWCDDDGAGHYDPRLAGQFPAGTYAVYVGTYQRGRRARYELVLSEQPAQQPAYVAQAPAPRATATVRVAAPEPRRRAPDCRQVLLEVGQHASYLNQCEGAEPYCAAALLRAGQHPSFLNQCRGVQPDCAVTLMEVGQHPSYLNQCRGVQAECSVALLRSGQHPSYLSQCR
ncbi:MAG: hypothetical protein H6721_31975 [Sandaracinus sp.]|nr:hypothetical protein [Sandaracinus sp.]